MSERVVANRRSSAPTHQDAEPHPPVPGRNTQTRDRGAVSPGVAAQIYRGGASAVAQLRDSAIPNLEAAAAQGRVLAPTPIIDARSALRRFDDAVKQLAKVELPNELQAKWDQAFAEGTQLRPRVLALLAEQDAIVTPASRDAAIEDELRDQLDEIEDRLDPTTFAGPTTPPEVIATPDFKSLRVGDRYTQTFRVDQSGKDPWVVTSRHGLTEVLTHKATTASVWKGTIEGVRPNLEIIDAKKAAASKELSIHVTLDHSKVESTRFHEPAGFADLDAGMMYVNDRLRLETTFDVGKHATLEAALAPTDGVFEKATATIVDRKLTLDTRALKEGEIEPRIAVKANGEDTHLRLGTEKIGVVPVLAGPKDVRRVRTNDIDAAVLLLGTEVNALLLAQRSGVLDAKDAILRKKAEASMPFLAHLAMFFLDAVISFVTAGVGARLGRKFGSWMEGQGGKLVGLELDMQAGFNAAIKDSLKARAKEELARATDKDGTSLPEAAAVDLLCSSLTEAYAAEANNQQADWINNFDGFKQLEAKQAGAGLAAVEAHRRMIAADQDQARLDAGSATVREWLKLLAQSTHGTTPMYGMSTGPEGTNLGRSGRGEIHVGVGYDRDHPHQPVTIGSVSFTGIEEADLVVKAGGRLIDLGVPYQVASARGFTLGRNEIGDIWVTLISGAMGIDAGWSKQTKQYLFEKGTRRKTWEDDAELEAGMRAGATLILETEVGRYDIASLQKRRGS